MSHVLELQSLQSEEDRIFSTWSILCISSASLVLC